jgi:SYF2 splicing factor
MCLRIWHHGITPNRSKPREQEYEARKAADPEFYRTADSLEYGKAVPIPEENVDRMVEELNSRCAMRQMSVDPSFRPPAFCLLPRQFVSVRLRAISPQVTRLLSVRVCVCLSVSVRLRARSPCLSVSVHHVNLSGQCRKSKREAYSRRRRHEEDKDIDFINPRNANFNRKIERAFGKYTQEIKANLERGTALPDH